MVGTLVDTLGRVDEDDIERLLTESADKGLTMGHDGSEAVSSTARERLFPGENSVSQCREAGANLAGDIGEAAGVEHWVEGSTREDRGSQGLAQPPRRLIFESCRQGEGDELEASWGQAFDDCRHNLVRVCRKKGATW